jgi:hypothetical protein
MSIERADAGTKPSKSLGIALWVVQGLLALTFVGTGIWKLVTPIPDLAKMIPWVGQVSASLLYVTAVFDTLGGLGIVLPSLTRIKPGLTVLAGLGCAVLQVCAIAFHFSRGELANTPFNFLLAALSLVVSWGRHSKAPISARP